MLSARTVLDRAGLEIFDVACRHRRGRGSPDEQITGHAIVFVRRGCFVRSVNGVEHLLDTTVAYCANPGEEQRYDHPHDDGDDCTSIFMHPQLAASLWGGEPELPSMPLHVSAELDLEHRLLLSQARAGGDPDALFERGITLGARALEQADAQRVASGRPGTSRARRAIADGAREILAREPACSLPALAQRLSVSPHHLSRVFRATTGLTISRHRMRLRARGALERLAGGEEDLARLAADVGFCDQSHLCRVIGRETGSVPSGLRLVLAGAANTGSYKRRETYGETLAT